MKTLFELEPIEKPPRKPARKLMHVIDAGPGFDKKDMCRFKCKCGHESDWMLCGTTEAKRGLPCPVCNADPSVGQIFKPTWNDKDGNEIIPRQCENRQRISRPIARVRWVTESNHLTPTT